MTQLAPARNKPGARTLSRSRDQWTHKSRHHQNQPESCQAPYFKYNHLRRNSESGREVLATEDPALAEPPELEPRVTSFLRGSAENLEEEEEVPSPEPPVEELWEWVTWKAGITKAPDRWKELLVVPGVPNCKKLAWKIWASFSHPKRASEVNKTENYCQAPLPHCVSLEVFSIHLQILSLPAEILGRYRGRRQ